ncbi:MAG: MtrB/PioB family outer membrane beta-barrel protein, partial [Alphaproteobacteria bacterium]|nr:MtrB/PioB family outer membrane beta-barrel protein [Alphaproteobacteria bacterium]
MTTRNILKAAAFACACMLPLTVAAHADDNSFDIGAAPATATAAATPDYDNEVTVGIDGVTKRSAVFGRYNGETESGAGLTGSADLNARGAWNGSDADYFHFDANDVNIGQGHVGPEASANAKLGEQGKWGMNFGYDAMTYTATDHFTTVFNKDGTWGSAFAAAVAANAGVPTVALGSTNEMTGTVGTRRDKGILGGNYKLGKWLLSSSFSEEHKE